ncbi:VOC family protein [Lentilitoribacter sp. EG35]|uniref:VOC family protein n=1 Tax=Lentilitoribacter sp. EG35 TaxID=3234192 RepID=UPI00345F88B2
MAQFISALTLVVDDYDKAIAFYVDVLGFSLIEDTVLSAEKRWVVVQPVFPKSQHAASLLLAKADGEEQRASIGNQTGGRVAFFLKTNDFHKDYQTLKEKGVCFLEEPRAEQYGHVVVFADPFGNKWDLLEHI